MTIAAILILALAGPDEAVANQALEKFKTDYKSKDV